VNKDGAASRLNELLAATGLEPLEAHIADKFEAYLSLFIRWDERLNLSAVRDAEGILSRHFIESIAVARALPTGIAALLDFGSGAGLPGIPIALCRPEIAVTLAESQGKKAAFLQEAARVLGIRATVFAGRAEVLRTVFDCVTLRAVEKMPRAVTAAARLVAPEGWLTLMTTRADLALLQASAGAEFGWTVVEPLPDSFDRIVALGKREPMRAATESGPKPH
jgi:16S rRNA (guanine527-N7)-methyltransferase